MTKKKQPIIFDDLFMDKLCKLPDLLFAEDLDTVSKAKLVFVLNALDDSAEHINDYLTDSGHSINHTYPDISDSRH